MVKDYFTLRKKSSNPPKVTKTMDKTDQYSTGQVEEIFPAKIRNIGLAISSVISIAILAYYITFIMGCVNATPHALDLSIIFIFSTSCVIFFGVPWHQLGLSLKKFGPFEFEQKLEGQLQERIQEISYIEDKLAKLETSLNQKATSKTISNNSTPEQKMKDLIVKFLTEFQSSAYSPVRMEKWGAKQNGYSKFKNQLDLIRRMLRKLVVEKQLETRLSKRGNTLYSIKR